MPLIGYRTTSIFVDWSAFSLPFFLVAIDFFPVDKPFATGLHLEPVKGWRFALCLVVAVLAHRVRR